MVAAITWYVRTKRAKLIFAGFASDPGNHMAARGTIATAMTRTRPETHGKVKKNPDRHCRDIYSTAIDTWTICNHSNSKTSYTPWQRYVYFEISYFFSTFFLVWTVKFLRKFYIFVCFKIFFFRQMGKWNQLRLSICECWITDDIPTY